MLTCIDRCSPRHRRLQLLLAAPLQRPMHAGYHLSTSIVVALQAMQALVAGDSSFAVDLGGDRRASVSEFRGSPLLQVRGS